MLHPPTPPAKLGFSAFVARHCEERERRGNPDKKLQRRGLDALDRRGLWPRDDGFSLVELSIVLVILGLLVGGVLSGQSLIRAAELRALTSDLERYRAATFTFRDKYFALPGDMTNATQFWGKDNTNCASDTGTAAANGTCNGNGNGIYEGAAIAGGTSEEFQFWKQLALASLIEGTYTGISGAGSTVDAIIGTNVPKTKISNGGFSIQMQAPVAAGNTQYYPGAYGNMLQAGTKNPGARTGFPLLRPEETWNIDTKIDDGRPSSGFIRVDKPSAPSPNSPNCADSDADVANYRLSNTGIACRILMLTGNS